MLQSIMNFLGNKTVKGIVAVVCAVIMYYAPDEVDKVIEMFLAFYGASHLVIKEKET